jgi:thioredoxin 1
MSAVLSVTTHDFDTQVLQSPLPVLLDIMSTHCPPCKMLAPVLESLAAEYTGRVRFVQINAEEDGEVAARYGIQATPTLLFFKGGKVVDQIIGAPSRTVLVRKLETLIP